MLEYGGDYAGGYLLQRSLFMPWELPAILPPDVVREGLRRLAPLELIKRELTPQPSAPAARVSALESTLYMRNQLLRDTDWASMAHSIEVRTPLVDATLLRNVAEIAATTGEAPSKLFITEAPSRPLPAGVRGRAKTGFTTPVGVWQRRGALGRCDFAARGAGEPWARSWAFFVRERAEYSWQAA
jgi:asparagine synthase (glutamine-hydrolysing)